jgi:hypothetical protein
MVKIGVEGATGWFEPRLEGHTFLPNVPRRNVPIAEVGGTHLLFRFAKKECPSFNGCGGGDPRFREDRLQAPMLFFVTVSSFS